MTKEVEIAKFQTPIGTIAVLSEPSEELEGSTDVLIHWNGRLIALIVPQVEQDRMLVPPEVHSVRVAVWPDPLFDNPTHIPVRAVYEEDESVYDKS